jgi:prevent-host-death family protein
MSQFNIAEAKAHFSQLVRKALAGEEVIIAKDNEPLVKLVPVKVGKGKRKPGSAKHKLVSLARDFDQVPEEFRDYV